MNNWCWKTLCVCVRVRMLGLVWMEKASMTPQCENCSSLPTFYNTSLFLHMYLTAYKCGEARHCTAFKLSALKQGFVRGGILLVFKFSLAAILSSSSAYFTSLLWPIPYQCIFFLLLLFRLKMFLTFEHFLYFSTINFITLPDYDVCFALMHHWRIVRNV